MKFYFGEVPHTDIESFGMDGLFENNGNYYYNCVEFGTNPGGRDEISIQDSCGRMVPLAVSHLASLIAIAEECTSILKDIKQAEEIVEMLESNGIAEVDSFGDIDYNN